MKVWELIKKLSEYKAGEDVYILVGETEYRIEDLNQYDSSCPVNLLAVKY